MINKGFTLIEVLLSVSVLALLTTFSIGILVYIEQYTLNNLRYKKAIYLAEEGIEAVKNIKDNSFSALSNGTFTLETSYTNGKWILTNGSETMDNFFTRNIVISTVDTNTKKIESKVSYLKNTGGTVLVSLSTYLANFAKSVGGFLNPVQNSLNLSGGQAGIKVATEGNYAY